MMIRTGGTVTTEIPKSAPREGETATMRGYMEADGWIVYWVASREQRDAIAGQLAPAELKRVAFLGEHGAL